MLIRLNAKLVYLALFQARQTLRPPTTKEMFEHCMEDETHVDMFDIMEDSIISTSSYYATKLLRLKGDTFDLVSADHRVNLDEWSIESEFINFFLEKVTNPELFGFKATEVVYHPDDDETHIVYAREKRL